MNDSKPVLGRQARGHLYLGSFAGALEARFRAEVAEIVGSAAAPGLRVLVPSREVRDRLRRGLADCGVPTFDLRFQLLPEVADSILAAAAIRRGPPGPDWRLLSPTAEQVLLAGLVRRWMAAGPRRGLCAVADQGGFLTALRTTFIDLEEASVSATVLEEQLGTIEGHAADAAAGLAGLYAGWEATLAERRLETRPRRMARAAAAAAHLEDERLVLYGFYDWSGVQETLLAALAVGRLCSIFVPRIVGDGRDYGQQLLERFRSLGLERVDLEEAGLPAVTLTFSSAAGERREAEGAVRHLLGRLATQPIPLDRVAVLYRAAEAYAEPLSEALSRAGLPAHRLDPPRLVETAVGSVARLLLEAAGSDFGRRQVLDFLDVALPLRPGADQAGTARRLAAWDALTREAGIVAGAADWIAPLDRLRQRLQARRLALRHATSDDGDADDDTTRGGAAARLVRVETELLALDALRAEIGPLFASLEEIRRATDWGALAARLSGELTRWLPPTRERELVEEAMGDLAALAVTGEPVAASLAARALVEALELRPAPGTPNDPAGVFVGGVMAARGLAFDLIYLVGVNDRVFPRDAVPDPLLRDVERLRLGARGYRLPLHRRQRDEEAALFELTTKAAPELVLSWSRVEPATGKPRLPGTALLDLAGAAAGRRLTAEELEALAVRLPLDRLSEARASGRRHPDRIAPFSAANPLLGGEALDLREFERLCVAAAVGAGDGARLTGLAARQPGLRRALDAESARWRSREITPWDGRLADPAALEWLGRRFPPAAAWSATTLESYARCPFRFFVETLLEAEDLEEPEERLRLDPLDRGQILHAILCEFLAEPGTLDRLRAEPRPARERLLSLATGRLEAFEREGRVGRPLLWGLERERILDDLGNWFEFERRRPEGFETLYREWRFGMPSTGDDGDDPASRAEPFVVLDAGGRTLAFKGRIDRVDADAGRRGLRVIDYKSGFRPRVRRTLGFPRGESLQLPIYLLAVAEGGSGVRGEAEYLYLSDGTSADALAWDDLQTLAKELVERVVVLADGVRGGLFFGYAGEAGAACRECRLAGVCGAGAERRFELKRGDPDLKDWLRLKGGGA